MFPLEDTIVALATAARGGPRGILRLSGPDVIAVIAQWFKCDKDWQDAKAAVVHSGQLALGGDRHLPCDLYLWPDNRSYTRQPSAELHTFGVQPLLARTLENLCGSGARLAQPGEFTLRAFLAGRLDLTQAEAVLGVIDANNDASFRVALKQLAGGLSGSLNQLRDELLNLCADLEAGLDFVEEDIEFVTQSQLVERLTVAKEIIQATLKQMDQRGGRFECSSCCVGRATERRQEQPCSTVWSERPQPSFRLRRERPVITFLESWSGMG